VIAAVKSKPDGATPAACPGGWLAGLACMFLLLAGCAGPSYYAQAISGHLGLMSARQDAAELMSSSGDPELVRRLQLAADIRSFAVERLGLPDNGSYTRFVRTGREAVTWNVVAAPEFSVEAKEWCFPVSGCVPYRGYFQRGQAEKFAGQMTARGYDVDISPVTAYSTLGWFADPLLDTMFIYGDEQLAAVLFHELAHQKIYVKGAAGFNEAYASFVEAIGMRMWLEAAGQAEALTDWERRRTASLQFSGLLLGARGELERLYASGRPEDELRRDKAEAFSRLRRHYASLRDGSWAGRDYFGGWFARELNNARLALLSSYESGSCAFERLYAEAGEDIVRFHQLAADKGAMDASARSAWLRQPCQVIAPPGDL
jgi:predicted aminopeptidase